MQEGVTIQCSNPLEFVVLWLAATMKRGASALDSIEAALKHAQLLPTVSTKLKLQGSREETGDNKWSPKRAKREER